MNRRSFMQLSSVGLFPFTVEANDNPTSLPTVIIDGYKILNGKEIFRNIPWKIYKRGQTGCGFVFSHEEPADADVSKYVYQKSRFEIDFSRETKVWLPEKNKILYGSSFYYFFGEVLLRQHGRKRGLFLSIENSHRIPFKFRKNYDYSL